MKQAYFIFLLVVGIPAFAQNIFTGDTKYLAQLEKSYNDLASDTIFLKSDEQGQQMITWHAPNDSAVLKRQVIHNYYSSFKPAIYTKTEYFSYSKKCLGWTQKDFDRNNIAGQLNYYDKLDNLIESFYWGPGEVGLRTQYFYNASGHIEKEVKYRGGKVVPPIKN